MNSDYIDCNYRPDAVDNELTAVPRNGSKAEIKDAFLAAGEEGRRQWHEFKTGLQAEAWG